MAATATTSAELLDLTNDSWELCATSIAERDELLAYAQSKGVPVWPATIEERAADALLLGWLGDLMCYDAAYPSEGPMTTPEQFKAMCDAYAAARHTAPPAPHGVRDLLLGLVAALLLSAMLPGCATTARPAERPVSQHDGFDSRTKHSEPYHGVR